MENNFQSTLQKPQPVNFGHMFTVLFVAALLLGVSWMKNPTLFSFMQKQVPAAADQDVPHYYAYVPPAEDRIPLVAGASTVDQGPSIINEDGSVTAVADFGKVLGASTADVTVPLDQISVNEIPDSDAAIKQYLAEAQNIETGYINNADFEAALSSGNQQQIDIQALKLTIIKNNLVKLAVPHSLVKLQKLKIAQYASGVGLLNNFTQADNNPELVGQYLDQFLKAQADMDEEMLAAQQKYGVNLGIVIPNDGQTSADSSQ